VKSAGAPAPGAIAVLCPIHRVCPRWSLPRALEPPPGVGAAPSAARARHRPLAIDARSALLRAFEASAVTRRATRARMTGTTLPAR